MNVSQLFFSETGEDFQQFMVDTQFEILRLLWENQCEMRVEIANLQMKLKKRSVYAELPVHQLKGVDGVVKMYDFQIPFLLKEDFDTFEEKMKDDEFYLEVVSWSFKQYLVKFLNMSIFSDTSINSLREHYFGRLQNLSSNAKAVHAQRSCPKMGRVLANSRKIRFQEHKALESNER